MFFPYQHCISMFFPYQHCISVSVCFSLPALYQYVFSLPALYQYVFSLPALYQCISMFFPTSTVSVCFFPYQHCISMLIPTGTESVWNEPYRPAPLRNGSGVHVAIDTGQRRVAARQLKRLVGADGRRVTAAGAVCELGTFRISGSVGGTLKPVE